MKAEASKDNMFTVLEQGDRVIENAKKKAVVLVGKTRAGKSCLFNWIKNNLMVGAGKKWNTYYKRATEGQDLQYAEESNGLTSKTLIPNIGELDKETSLIDMAGFADNRNYIGVMGVSYFLKSVFEQVD